MLLHVGLPFGNCGVDMATAQISWQWDAARQQYYYDDAAAKVWIYQDKTRIPYDHRSTSTQVDPTSLRAAEPRQHNLQGIRDSSYVSTYESSWATYSMAQPNMQSTQTQTSSLNLRYAPYPVHHQYPVSPGSDSGPDWRDKNVPQGSFMNTKKLFENIEVVRDDLLCEGRGLFRKPLRQLHYINPKKEHISLLVCQHLLRPYLYACAERWPHTHPDLDGHVPYIGLYLEPGSDEQTLVIDLKEINITTVSFGPTGSPQKSLIAKSQQRELIALLRHATRGYRQSMSERLADHTPHRHSWEEFHNTELKHYKWLHVYTMPTPDGVSSSECTLSRCPP